MTEVGRGDREGVDRRQSAGGQLAPSYTRGTEAVPGADPTFPMTAANRSVAMEVASVKLTDRIGKVAADVRWVIGDKGGARFVDQ